MTTMLYYTEYRSWYVWFFGNLMSAGEYRPPYPYEGICACDSRGLTVAV